MIFFSSMSGNDIEKSYLRGRKYFAVRNVKCFPKKITKKLKPDDQGYSRENIMKTLNFEQMEQVNGGNWVCTGALFLAWTPWFIGASIAAGPFGALAVGAAFTALDKVVCN